jgi:hypothetical protein
MSPTAPSQCRLYEFRRARRPRAHSCPPSHHSREEWRKPAWLSALATANPRLPVIDKLGPRVIVSVLSVIVLDGSADKALTERMRKGLLGPSRLPQTFYLSHGRHWARTSDPQLVDYGKASSGVVRARSNAGLRTPPRSRSGTVGQENLTQI